MYKVPTTFFCLNLLHLLILPTFCTCSSSSSCFLGTFCRVSFSMGTFFYSGMIRTGSRFRSWEPLWPSWWSLISMSHAYMCSRFDNETYAVNAPFSSLSSAFNQQMTVSEFPPGAFQTAPEVAAHKFNHHLFKQDT